MLERLGAAVSFSIYGIFCALTILFIRYAITETRGKDLEAISGGKA
jgi:hypothetical protein